MHVKRVRQRMGPFMTSKISFEFLNIVRLIRMKTCKHIVLVSQQASDARVMEHRPESVIIRKLSLTFESGLLCVGERLGSVSVSHKPMHPLIMPDGHQVADLTIPRH